MQTEPLGLSFLLGQLSTVNFLCKLMGLCTPKITFRGAQQTILIIIREKSGVLKLQIISVFKVAFQRCQMQSGIFQNAMLVLQAYAGQFIKALGPTGESLASGIQTLRLLMRQVQQIEL